jgi:thioesterase domain-containing protein
MYALFNDIDMRSMMPSVTQTPPGLVAAYTLEDTHAVHKIFCALANAHPQQFPFAGMYAFGWSGGIQVQERKSAAHELFNLIQALAQKYKDLHGTSPNITLITHSHGGNLALHMAKHASEESCSIQRLILLSCPVQEKTASYTQHPFFNKLYSLHSHDDWFQTMDQESLQAPRKIIEKWQKEKTFNAQEFLQAIRKNKWELGSARHFATYVNLIQAQLIWEHEPKYHVGHNDKALMCERILYKALHPFSHAKRGMLHTEFTTPLFFKQLPHILQKLDAEWAQYGPVSHCLALSIAGS